jgi:tetratricopeptide (TPR) repeat protein
MGKARESLRLLAPGATVFVSSACVMVLGLVASRLVARDLGSSLYTWTSVIGIMLAGISVGTYAGGRIADRYHPRRALAVLFGASSAACVAAVILNNAIGGWLWLWRLNWPLHTLIHVSLTFLLPSALLGTIAPVVTKIALDRGLSAGRTIGILCAWGAAGGIVGTFAAGFYLIPAFGSTILLWSVGAAMLVLAVLYWVSCWTVYLWAAIFAALATMGVAGSDWAQSAGASMLLRERADPNTLYAAETPYCRVAVRRISWRPDRRVLLQGRLECGEVVMGDAASLHAFSTRVFAALTHGLAGDHKKPSMLLLGSGGYVFARHLEVSWPDSLVEVIEPDPGVTRAAMAAFDLDRNTAIQIVRMGARNYVDQLLRQEPTGGVAKRYDFIYADVMNGGSVPTELVTKEFNDRIASLLSADGVYMTNLTDTQESGRFLGAVVNTLGRTFASVCVVAEAGSLRSVPESFVVVAAKRKLDVAAILNGQDRHVKSLLLNESEMADLRDRCDNLTLTDDYAPVENLLAPAVRQGEDEALSRKYFDRARALQAEGQADLRRAQALARDHRDSENAEARKQGVEKYRQSIDGYTQAAKWSSSVAIRSCYEIGMMRMEMDEPQEAVRAFADAVKCHKEAGMQDGDIAVVHMQLGLLLRRAGKAKEGHRQLEEAARWFRIELERDPLAVTAWEQLGDTLAFADDMKGASEAFEKALSLEPGYLPHYEKLARSLERQGRYAEALDVARRQMTLLKKLGRREEIAQLTPYIELLEYRKAKQRL